MLWNYPQSSQFQFPKGRVESLQHSRCGTTARFCRLELPFLRFLRLRPRNPPTRCFHRRLHLQLPWRPRPMQRRASRRRLENGSSWIPSGTATRGNSGLSRRRKRTCLPNMSGKSSGKCSSFQNLNPARETQLVDEPIYKWDWSCLVLLVWGCCVIILLQFMVLIVC